MREYVSPGIYTQEYDKSFLPTAPPAGSAAIFVGGFTKGQAFVPMRIKDTYDLLDRTGEPNGLFYSQYAAYEYSKHKGDFYVQRILWDQQWTSEAYLVTAQGDDGIQLLAVLFPTGDSVDLSTSTSAEKSGDSWSDLTFGVTDGTTTTSYTWSFADVVNIDGVVGTNPVQSTPLYLFGKTANYDATDNTGSFTTISIVKQSDFFTSQNGYKNARTPSVFNQYNVELFHFETLGDGTYTNKEIKIAIEGLQTASSLEYAKFDVIVRAYDDTQKKPQILEAFYEVTLDPTDIAYIGKRIGDMYQEWDRTNNKTILHGDFPNNSKYIRVVVSDQVKNKNVAPLGNVYGIEAIPVTGSDTYEITCPTPYTHSSEVETRSLTLYHEHQGYDVSLGQVKFLSNPLHNSATTTSLSIYTVTGDYIIPFYGGFDGRNPSDGFTTDQNTLYGFDFTSQTSSGSAIFIEALGLLRNVQQYDIDVVSIAGVNLESEGKKSVFEYALQEVCEFRGDCIVVAEACELGTMTTGTITTYTEDFDSSYGAVYYPGVKIKCDYTKTYPDLPGSALIPSVIAYTEKVSQPHYAPAGINRGTLNVLQALTKLTRDQRDSLYKYNINPIASFAANGTVVWGQKTLQKAASALDRLNVRILVNRIKKWIETYGKTVLFDNNTVTLRQVFTLGVESYLNNIVSVNGLYAYRFVMDQTNNTPEVIDRNQLVGEVWLKPTKTAQFIIIPINIVRTDMEI